MAVAKQRKTSRDDHVVQVFLEALDAVGGARSLVETDQLGWLPDLMLSAYIIVLQEDEHKNPDDIAALLGVSKGVVESVLAAPTETALQRFRGELPLASAEREHIAGGVARFAYGIVKRQGIRPVT